MQKRPLTSWKHIESAPFRAETPSPFPNSVKSTPASIGDSATMDIHKQLLSFPLFLKWVDSLFPFLDLIMELLTPSCEFPYKDSFENSPATIPITIENASPLETSRRLSPTSTPFPPSPTILNEQIDAYKCFHLAENSDDISEILDLLEPNKLLLRTWSYFQHCQQTAQKLEKEARFQKDLVEDLMTDLRTLGINEIL